MSNKKPKHPLIERMEEAQKAFQAEAKRVLGEETLAFFAANPEIGQIRWRQYTPYFNDGDTCEFGVNDPAFLPNRQSMSMLPEDVSSSLKETSDEDMDDYSDVCAVIKRNTTLHYDPKGKREPTERERSLLDACANMGGLIQGLDETMKGIFGDHVQVAATAGGFDVAEYEHD